MTAQYPPYSPAELRALRMDRRVFGDAVEILPPEAYLSDAYFEARRSTVSASEIATIMGIAPPHWTSRFDLWWAKASGVDTRAENKGMRRGKRLEALVVADFAEAHPEFHVEFPVGLLANKDRPWQTATPDGAVFEHWSEDMLRMASTVPVVARDVHLSSTPVAGLEAKTSGSREGWGEAGTDEVPVYYRAQAMWQLDAFGVDVTFMPTWFGTDYREYVIERDDADLEAMREAAWAFLEDLAHDRQPDIDSALATRRRLLYQHPSVTEGETEIPRHWVRFRQGAAKRAKAAKERQDYYENLIRNELGDLNIGTVDGRKVVSRSVFTKSETVIPEHVENRLYFTKPPKPSKEDS
jgi:putative phage-type endonuclease